MSISQALSSANQNFIAFFGMVITMSSIISSHPSREKVLTRSEAGWRPTGSPGLTCSHSSLSSLQGRFASHATSFTINHSGFITTNSFTFISVHVLVLSYTWSVKEIQRSLSERCDEMGRMESEELFFCQSQLIYLPVLTFFGEGIFKENSYWLMLIGFFPTPVKMLNSLFTIAINDWLVLF